MTHVIYSDRADEVRKALDRLKQTVITRCKVA